MGRGWSNISLYYHPELKNLMDSADIAISAAGSTTYELAACGVPSILLVVAENQKRLAEEAEKQGIAINLGCSDKIDRNHLFLTLDVLLADHHLRQKIACQGQTRIDGRGAERVAEVLLTCYEE